MNCGGRCIRFARSDPSREIVVLCLQGRASLERRLGNYQAACDYLRDLLAIEPDNIASTLNLCAMLGALGEYAEASRRLDELLAGYGRGARCQRRRRGHREQQHEGRRGRDRNTERAPAAQDGRNHPIKLMAEGAPRHRS